MVRIASGRDLPWWRKVVQSQGRGALLPCSLEGSSLAPSLFDNGPGVCCNDTKHCSLPSFLPLGKTLPRRSPKCKHFFCFRTSALLESQNNAQIEEGTSPHPLCPRVMPRSGVDSLFEDARNQLQKISLSYSSKPNIVIAPHVFEWKRDNSGHRANTINCSSLPAHEP